MQACHEIPDDCAILFELMTILVLRITTAETLRVSHVSLHPQAGPVNTTPKAILIGPRVFLARLPRDHHSPAQEGDPLQCSGSPLGSVTEWSHGSRQGHFQREQAAKNDDLVIRAVGPRSACRQFPPEGVPHYGC